MLSRLSARLLHAPCQCTAILKLVDGNVGETCADLTHSAEVSTDLFEQWVQKVHFVRADLPDSFKQETNACATISAPNYSRNNRAQS